MDPSSQSSHLVTQSLLSFLLLIVPFSGGNPHRKSNLFTAEDTSGGGATRYFEVKRPIEVPPATKPCVVTVLRSDFGNTYRRPPVTANYAPPPDCPHPSTSSKIVLRWDGMATGRQFDRIFGVWLGGVELLRSCTAEPRATGLVWTVEKDVSRYRSLFNHNQTLAVCLGNLVDQTYTAVYHVKVELLFYPYGEAPPPPEGPLPGYRRHADLILPVSRDLPLDDGLWFEVENSMEAQGKEFSVPRNAYRAVVEISVSFHEKDEFWYTNLPDEYLAANNLTSSASGNGPFREVVVYLDGRAVAAVCPFTVIYTGGVNPLLWRPITAIGSFDLPSYDVELTPFLGRLLDGMPHSAALAVTDSLNVWYLGMNLHVWLDPKWKKTQGELLLHHCPPPVLSSTVTFQGLNGNFQTKAERWAHSVGWVRSSFGTITTCSTQNFEYTNSMTLSEGGLLQVVHQTVRANRTVEARALPGSYPLYSLSMATRFPLRLSVFDGDRGGGSWASVVDLTLGFEQAEEEFGREVAGVISSSLNNSQWAHGVMAVEGNIVLGGVGSTQQVYDYRSSGGSSGGCYFRNVSSFNYTVIFDTVREVCPSEMGRPPTMGPPSGPTRF